MLRPDSQYGNLKTDITIVAVEFAKIVEDQPKAKDYNDTIAYLKPWAAAFVLDENTSRVEGISAIVRMLMTGAEYMVKRETAG